MARGAMNLKTFPSTTDAVQKGREMVHRSGHSSLALWPWSAIQRKAGPSLSKADSSPNRVPCKVDTGIKEAYACFALYSPFVPVHLNTSYGRKPCNMMGINNPFPVNSKVSSRFMNGLSPRNSLNTWYLDNLKRIGFPLISIKSDEIFSSRSGEIGGR